MCSLLVSMDDVIKLSILNALEEILKVGEREAKYTGVMNKYMVEIDECYGKALIFVTFSAFNIYSNFIDFPPLVILCPFWTSH